MLANCVEGLLGFIQIQLRVVRQGAEDLFCGGYGTFKRRTVSELVHRKTFGIVRQP